MKFYFQLYSFSSYTYVYTPFWVNFCLLVGSRVQLHSSTFVYPVVPVPFIEEAVLSSSALSRHSSLLNPHSVNFTPVRYTSLWSYYFSNYQVFCYSTWTFKSLKQIYVTFTFFSLASCLHLKTFIKYLLLCTRQYSRFPDIIPTRH